MALRPPPVRARTDVALHFPDERSASEVRSLGGSRLAIRFDELLEVPAVVVGGDGDVLHAHAEWDLAAQPLPSGVPVEVCWAELNDLASVDATLSVGGPGELRVDCAWPPARVQRRSFRRCLVEVPVWIVRTGLQPSVVRATTKDLSGSGLAAHAPWTDLEVGEEVVVMLRLPDRELVLPATIHWSRNDNAVLGLRFEKITPSDQDHLVQLVIAAEAVRG